MLNKIIGFSIHNKLIIGLFTIALIIYGAFELTKLPIDAVPDITNNQVQIITVAPSYGATDIERLVTFPIEQANCNISGIEEIRSFSRFGLSLVTIVFKDNIDIYWARQQVAERLQKVQMQIPKGIGLPEIGPISTGLGEIYQYVVRAKEGYENKYNETELRTIQDWIVRRQLLGVEGVVEVSSFGGKLKQYEIAINYNKLHSLNLSIEDVFTAVENNNQNTGGSYIEKGPTVLFIKTEGLLKNKEDIENIVIKSVSGVPILVKNIAEVKISNATRYGAMCYNDKGEAAGAVVMMLKGANSSKVIKNVKEKIEQITSTLPEGVIVEPFLDRTKMVNNAINTVEKNLMEGALIVIFILVLFLGNLRAGLIVASVIPLSMLIAVILMNLFGVSGNLMSLGALDFGLIVDGAVIIVEAVMHQLSHNKKYTNISHITQKEMNLQVEGSAGKMMNSAVFGQLIILIVYLPIFTLEGIEGKMFKPMAQTVAFALVGAFVLSLTYIPMMSSFFISKKIKHEPGFSDKIMSKVEVKFQQLLTRILKTPRTVIAIVISIFAFAIIILSQLGGEFIPALEEGDFAVEVRLLTGSNLQTSINSTQQASKLLLANFPEIEKIVTKIGSGEVPTDPMPIEAADLMIILKDKSEWTSAKTFNELAEKMSNVLSAVPGITTGFQYPVQMRFNELMTGARQDVVCKIFGEDIDTLARYSQLLGKIASAIEGAEDVYIEPISGMPQISINYKRDLIAQYGLNITDINKTINTAFAGQVAGQIYEGEKKFDITVKLDKNSRQKENDIKNILIKTPQGNFIPLHQIADVISKIGPNQIQREDAKRRIVVGFNVRNRDVQSVVNDIQKKIKSNLKMPSGYFIKYGGSFENLNAAKQRLMIAVPISLVLIFLLLFFAFNSVKHGLIIYSAIPLSAIGGILFLAIRDIPFSISAGVGFIALFGVAVLNGIVLLAEFNRLKADGEPNLIDIVIKGTTTRLRPVLMTAFVASLGFLPMAISNGAGAEVQRPLATVVIGGLLIATFLTLFVLPILYVMFERSNKSNKIPKVVTAIFIVFLLNIQTSKSQTISLESAIDSALVNNLKIKNSLLLNEYQDKLVKSAYQFSLTTVGAEIGQINSSYIDSKIGITQSFSLPMVYKKQKNVLNEELNAAILNTSLSKAEIKKHVREVYQRYLILQQKNNSLIKTDSVFNELLDKTILKQKAGDINIIEQKSIEIKSAEIKTMLLNVKSELEITLLQFQLLINCKENYSPLPLPNTQIKAIQANFNPNHPLLKINEQKIKNANSLLKLEKSKLLPEINAGYFNQSLRGVGADNQIYQASNRFHFAQIGLGVPILYNGNKSKINAAKITVKIAENEYAQSVDNYNRTLKEITNKFLTQTELVKLYENQIIPSAQTMLDAANKQYNLGEINYLEWSIISNQNTTTVLKYFDELIILNQLQNEIKFLTEN